MKQTREYLPYRVQRIKTKILAEQWFSMWMTAVAAAFMTKYDIYVTSASLSASLARLLLEFR